MPPRGVRSAKRVRRYEDIMESEQRRGRSPRRAKEIAGATVNKQRAEQRHEALHAAQHQLLEDRGIANPDAHPDDHPDDQHPEEALNSCTARVCNLY